MKFDFFSGFEADFRWNLRPKDTFDLAPRVPGLLPVPPLAPETCGGPGLGGALGGCPRPLPGLRLSERRAVKR